MAARATIFLLHAYGGSRRAFDRVSARLGEVAPELTPVAIDLPGFGAQSAAVGVTVEAMADHVITTIGTHLARHDTSRWLLVGHSMGGKIATVVAARTLSGQAPLFGLAGVVLLAGSPPVPEPMSAERRAEMRSWADDGGLDETQAREFIDANVGSPLPPDLDALALADLLRSSPEAWRAWLDRGSTQDWGPYVAALDLPALLVVGGADGEDLGAASQRRLNGAVYPRAGEVLVLDGAGHLLPLERPDEVARAIASFWTDRAGLGPQVPPGFARVIASDHTSARTRGLLAGRAVADDPTYAPQVLDQHQLGTLRAVAARVLPLGGPPVDLAARLDAQLGAGLGDGWRPVDLPGDPEAYRTALDDLADFAELSEPEQDQVLGRLADATYDVAGATFTPAQLQNWFADARNDLVRLWLAHPAGLARAGFDGFANGGDGLRKQGFEEFAAGRREAWEPTEIPTEVRLGPTRTARAGADL